MSSYRYYTADSISHNVAQFRKIYSSLCRSVSHSSVQYEQRLKSTAVHSPEFRQTSSTRYCSDDVQSTAVGGVLVHHGSVSV